MHPAQKVGFVFIGLVVAVVATSGIYAAVTTDKAVALAVGWTLLPVAFVFLAAAFVSLIVWRVKR